MKCPVPECKWEICSECRNHIDFCVCDDGYKE